MNDEAEIPDIPFPVEPFIEDQGNDRPRKRKRKPNRRQKKKEDEDDDEEEEEEVERGVVTIQIA